MSTRAENMVRTAPDYYQYSKLYAAIQQAIADDLDIIAASTADVSAQLYILTATWGLTYWEKTLGITTVVTDGYEIRRSRILAQWRGIGNFSVALIKSVCEAFINGSVKVLIRVPQHEVIVTFVGTRGIPPNIEDLQAQVENIIHAHLGLVWRFTYLVWEELDNLNLTWDEFDAMNFTWDDLEVWRPPV